MDETELGEALAELQEKSLGRIAAVEKKLDGALSKFDKAFAEAEKRTLFGGGRGTSDDEMLSPQQKAKLGNAIRALLMGDNAKANSLFSEVAERKDAIEGNDPSGGFLTVPEFSSTMTTIAAEISLISRLARTITLTQSGTFEEAIDKDTAQAVWTNETDPRGDTNTPGLGMFRVECFDLMAQPKISQTLIDDSAIDIVAWMTRKIGDAFGLAESAAFHSGNGVGRPRGVLTYPLDTADDKTRAWGKLQVIDSGEDGGFVTPTTSVNSADVLVDVVTALKAQYKANARWLMSRRTAGLVQTLKDSFGRWCWTNSLVAGTPSTLLGFPVEISEDMPDPAADSLSILFGDFRAAYTVVRRLGQRFLPDPYTSKPFTKLYSWERVGGGMNNFEALKVLRLSGP